MEESVNKGKAYANRKAEYLRPKGDLYHSPKSILWELLKYEDIVGKVWECACGDNALVEEFSKYNIKGFGTDLSKGFDFLNPPKIELPEFSTILTNPPFSLWDEFVMKAKEHNPDKIIMLGRTNYLGTHGRNIHPKDRSEKQKEKYGNADRIWDNLKTIYVFDRMIDYQTPKRDDGHFYVGNMVTGWFIWEKDYIGETSIKVLDIQKYATLGCFKKS